MGNPTITLSFPESVLKDLRVYREEMLMARDDVIFQEASLSIARKVEKALDSSDPEDQIHRVFSTNEGIRFHCVSGEIGVIHL